MLLTIFIKGKTKAEVAKDERYRREKTENEKKLMVGLYQYQSEVS